MTRRVKGYRNLAFRCYISHVLQTGKVRWGMHAKREGWRVRRMYRYPASLDNETPEERVGHSATIMYRAIHVVGSNSRNLKFNKHKAGMRQG